jgi:predicted metalloprotease
VGVLALTLTAVMVTAGLAGGDDAVTPAAPDSGPRATTAATSPDDSGEPAEVAPPSAPPEPRLRFGQGGGSTGITLAGSQRLQVDLRRMRQSDTRSRLTRNPLYGTGTMRATSCGAPRPSSRATDMNRFLQAVTGCLDRAWATKFSQAGALFLKPRRVFFNGSGRGPCGTYPNARASAYYCPSNSGIYIGLRHVIEASSGKDPAANPVIYLRVLAHEYGHHVQSMSGIGGAWWWEVAKKSNTAQDAHTRRNELQAQCFAGVFARSARQSLRVTSGLWQQTLQDNVGRGDENHSGRNDHGTGEHYAAWLHQGWRYARLSYCNTWASPPADVR